MENSTTMTAATGTSKTPCLPGETWARVVSFLSLTDTQSVCRVAKQHELCYQARYYRRHIILGERVQSFVDSLLFFPGSPLSRQEAVTTDSSIPIAALGSADTSLSHNRPTISNPNSDIATTTVNNITELDSNLEIQKQTSPQPFSFDKLSSTQKDELVEAIIRQKEVIESTWSIIPQCAFMEIKSQTSKTALHTLRNLAKFTASYEKLGDLLPGIEYAESIQIDRPPDVSVPGYLYLIETKKRLLPRNAKECGDPDAKWYYEPDPEEGRVCQLEPNPLLSTVASRESGRSLHPSESSSAQ